MANSKYEYVRAFEQPDSLLANTWIVVRIDGRGFSKLTAKYKFVKPNDRNALDLMNAAAVAVMKELPDLVLAYGNSDEYSFVFHKDCVLFERRASKLTTTIVSTFTSYYVFLWSTYFPDKPLTPPLPSFDGRAVCYPSDFNLRDYMSWRQVDCHINNLYNTTFWALVQQGGMGPREAEQRLSGSVSSDKNEILFKEFGINYNNEPECFKKGTVLYRDFFPAVSTQKEPSPTLVTDFSSPIASPQPRRALSRPVSQPIGRAAPYSQEYPTSPIDQGPGPTFLSTTSTPSPPASPTMMSRPAFPNPLRSNPVSPRTSTYPTTTSMPISPPSTVTSPYGNLVSPNSKQGFSTLVPLPLSPPTLRPSTKPPLSLDPPNPTTRTNFSPTTPPQDFPTAFPISGYTHATSSTANHFVTHSASASMSTTGPLRSGLKQRSPSQPHLPSYFASSNSYPPAGPPVIPLRISSIPTNNKPRKLSLHNQRSMSTIKPSRRDYEEKENFISAAQAGALTPRKVSPPLRTNKALPSPPMNHEEEMRTREKVMGSSPHQDWGMYTATNPQDLHRSASDSDKREGHVWMDFDAAQPATAELPATSAGPARRARSHSRLHSAPQSSAVSYGYHDVEHNIPSSTGNPPISFSDSPNQTPSTLPQDLDTVIQPTPPLKDSPRSKAAKTKTDALPSPKQAQGQADPPCRAKDFRARTAADPEDAQPKTSKNKGKVTEQGGWAAGTLSSGANEGRPVHMSRTQKDKERKKRSKAKVLIEHVDIIKDEFWEKRPWILSGKTA
ncbi:Thg1-domain-containing protein [Pyrenochaeta sp. DS3sAY3a]|nr:Thg1-domain-containing protein [Pyrenochaeta sp. DS3sAY3a]